jgi:UDP-glucose:tetrahydrobiopterin glucosyltransferase
MRVVGNGIDVDRHAFRARASEPPTLGWIGRICPEKGLADAAQVAARTGLPLAVWGYLQDADHFAEVVAAHPRARIEHRGFLATADLHRAIGGCAAILVTPAWDEAFGNVAVEAMAAGVPVLAYDRGGPGEIVVDGVTGYVVPAGDLDALADAVGRIDRIDRAACRRHAESEYSIAAMAARVERWLLDVVDD